MGRIILLGCEESKRTRYFLTAASRLDIKAEFCDIRNINKEMLIDKLVKIDPITYDSCEIEDLDFHSANYIELLTELNHVQGIRFLNTPNAIINVLSKENCKKILLANDINTTEVLAFNITSYGELKETMHLRKMYNVFIKPNYGAGAAGVIAYRFNPGLNRETIYTSANIIGDRLINTKTVVKYEDKHIVKKIINKILNGSAIVERWIPKAKLIDFSYDLRVVVQFGKVDFIVGRLSKNPITNLHLNNNAIDVHKLNITKDKFAEIEMLCVKALSAFKGLNVAGIDLLLTRDSLTPIIIEINAQGDLIYQDIYNRNLIYTNQILEMRRLNE